MAYEADRRNKFTALQCFYCTWFQHSYFFSCMFRFFLLHFCNKIPFECMTKQSDSFHPSLRISNPQSTNQAGSQAKPNTSRTSCSPHKRFLQAHTCMDTHALHSSEKQTSIALNKGLMTALDLDELVQCLIPQLIPLELLSIWLHFFLHQNAPTHISWKKLNKQRALHELLTFLQLGFNSGW